MAIIHVLGNLTKDPELREAGSSQVCGLRLAENAYIRGEKTTLYYDVSIWGRRGETAAAHLSKGSSVLIHGQFSTREYEKDGETRVVLDIGNADFQFAGGGAGSRDEAPASSSSSSDDEDFSF